MALTGLVVALGIAGASGEEPRGHHGEGHDPLHHWYKTLKVPGTGVACCDGRDCRPTRARMKDGGLEVLVDGKWTHVPPWALLKETPPDLQAHVCAPKTPGGTKMIYCVVLAPGV